MFRLETKIESSHRKTVSSVAISPSGSHFITGALDGELKMWDFAGMTKRKRYFRKISPEEGIAINSVEWNTPGNKFLVCPASSSAKIYDGEGNEVCQTPKGDMYLKDLNNTAGHIGHINGGTWDKANPNQFLTWANDGSIRLWDLNDLKKNKTVLKLKNRQNVKYHCTAAALAGERLILGASREGVIYLWDYRRPLRPKTIKAAHTSGEDICSLLPDSESFFSRSCDGVIRKWDFRQLSTFVCETELENESQFSKLRFSPDKQTVAAISNRNGASDLVLLSKTDLAESRAFPLGDEEAVCFDWNAKIGQAAFGTAKRGVLFFGAENSQRGARLCAEAAEYELSDEDFSAMIDPSLLREFRKVSRPAGGGKKVSMPEMSKTEANRVVKKNTFASGVFKKMKKSSLRDQDPRESILRYSQKAKDNPMFIRETR